MLVPVPLRSLLVDPASHPRGQPHLSAASGLVRVGPRMYTVADDEHHLGILEPAAGDAAAVRLHRIIPGDLPPDKGRRKKLKPDLEALLFWPPDAGHPHGALWAFGSGSRPNRQQAFIIGLGGNGLPDGGTQVIDLAGMYQPLRARLADLNIEGAFLIEGRLRLLQRANKGDARNACVDYSMADVQAWIAKPGLAPPSPVEIVPFSLGMAGGSPLGFTDGAAWPGGGWIFSAVAEDTGDSYADGACAGSAIGRVGLDGQLHELEAISGGPKVEGICLAEDGRLLMVTDSDDPLVPSMLLSLDLG